MLLNNNVACIFTDTLLPRRSVKSSDAVHKCVQMFFRTQMGLITLRQRQF